MKKLLSILLSVIILVASLPISTFASDGLVNQNLQASKNTENNTAFETQKVDVTLPNLNTTATTSTVTSGTTGDCTWTLDGTVLTISGCGYMDDYFFIDSVDLPWGTAITDVIIEEGVTNIGDYAFFCCRSLKNITIPNSITNSGDCAFVGCTALENVFINDIISWCNIDFSGFVANPLYFANNIFIAGQLVTQLVLPEEIISLNSQVFSGECLDSITISKNIANIDSTAFSNCSSLTNVYVVDDNPYFSDVDGVLFDKSTSKLLFYPLGKQASNYAIPNSVVNIENYAFSQCANLVSITIPNGVANIGNSAFSNCTSLLEMTIPDSVTSIDSGAFYGCTNLIKVTLPNNLKCISSCTFDGCSSLVNINIPQSVTQILASAFHNCTSLTNVYITDIKAWCEIDFARFPGFYETTNPLYYAENLYLNNQLITELVIPEGVTSIPYYAFSCNNVTSVAIPSSVVNIDEYAFADCYNLTNITIGNSNINIGYDTFSGCYNLKNVFINDLKAWCEIDFYDSDSNPLSHAENLYVDGELIKDLVVPENITNINKYAFYGFGGFKSISLSMNMSILEENVFGNTWNGNLKKIYIPKNIQLIKKYNFESADITDIYYEGTEQDWENLIILEGNEGLLNATVHYNSTGLPIAGDIDGTEGISDRDVVYLLNYTLDSENYPLNQDCDFNGDGVVNDRDVIYLLYHSFLPDKYPLY